jgi:putative transcriptional regulator
MTTTYFTLKPGQSSHGEIDLAKFDATTEEDIARQIAEDDEEARQDAIAYVRGVRLKLGLSQAQFADHLKVSITTIRNWEQGKRFPSGAVRTLYRILDRAPEASLAALQADMDEAAA